MASFEALPLELRQEIYSYLLVDHNVAKISGLDEFLEPCFSTSLFLLNKQISRESIRYFYSKNAFIYVEWPTFSSASVREYHRCCIMKQIDSSRYVYNRPRFEKKWPVDERFILSMRVLYGLSHLERGGAVFLSSIISTTQFRKLVKILNAYRWGCLCIGSDPGVNISLTFSWRTQYFKENRTFKDSIVNSLGLLKGTGEKNMIKYNTPAKKISFQINGDICAEQAEVIEDHSRLPLYPADLLQYGRDFLRLGDELFRDEFLAEAKGAYAATFAATTGICYDEWRRGFYGDSDDYDTVLNDTENHELNLMALERHVQMSHIHSKLGQTTKAVHQAHEAFKLWQVGFNPRRESHSGLMSEKQLVARLTKALTDNGLSGSIATLYQSYRESWKRDRTHPGLNRDGPFWALDDLAAHFWPEELSLWYFEE